MSEIPSTKTQDIKNLKNYISNLIITELETKPLVGTDRKKATLSLDRKSVV